MTNTVLVTEANGEVRARALSHVERFESIKQDVPWPVYNPKKEMVFFSPATGTLRVTKRQQVQATK